MSEKTYPPIDRSDLDFAMTMHLDKWLESNALNSRCARLLDQAISKPGYDRELLEEALDLYGKERVSYVLITATFSLSMFDKKISADNARWAYGTEHPFTPTPQQTEDYMLKAREDPKKLDGFISLYRQRIGEEQPFDKESVSAEEASVRVDSMILRSYDGRFAVYQIAKESPAARYQYFNMDLMQKYGYSPRGDCYDMVYCGSLDRTDRSDAEELEMIYTRFNTTLPEDFYGHSLSVSDVVLINRGKEAKAYFVDSIGFKELPGFVQERWEMISQLKNKIYDSAETVKHQGDSRGEEEECEHPKRRGR